MERDHKAEIAEAHIEVCDELEQALAANAELVKSLNELVDRIVPCDENMHPAWCCNHQTKRCDMNAVVSHARAALAKHTQAKGA